MRFLADMAPVPHNDGTYAVSFVDKDKPKNDEGYHPYRKEILERHHFELIRDLDFKEEKKYQAEQKRKYEERQAAREAKAERIGQWSAAKERTIDAKIKDSEELRQRDEARENLAQAQAAFDDKNTFLRRLFQYREYWEAKDNLDNRRRQLEDAEERARQYLEYMNSQRPSEKARQRREESRAADTARQEEAEQERQTMEAEADKRQRDNTIVKEAQTSPEAAKRLQHALQGETIQEKTDITTAQELAKEREALEREEEKRERERQRKAEKEQRGYDGEEFEDKAGNHLADKEQQNADILKQQQLEKDRQAERTEQEKAQEQHHSALMQSEKEERTRSTLELNALDASSAFNQHQNTEPQHDNQAHSEASAWHHSQPVNDNVMSEGEFWEYYEERGEEIEASGLSDADKEQAYSELEGQRAAWEQWQHQTHNQGLDDEQGYNDPERERGL